MKELKELVGKLEYETDQEKQIRLLQEIGKKLLTEYVIKIEDIIMEPLWVEAYYYHQEHFPDCNTHRSQKQIGRFDQLYFHDIGYGGMDLCLSQGAYYLSFLIKASFLYKDGEKKEFKKQTEIYDVCKKTGKTEQEIESIQNILSEKSNNCEVYFASRVNLTKPCFKKSELAAFRIDSIAIDACDFSFARASLGAVAEQYMVQYIKNNMGYSKKDYEDECRKVFGWLPDNVLKIIKEKRN